MKRVLATTGVLGLVVLGSVLLSSPAQATDGNIPVASDCNAGWYVNHDEENLLPKQTKDGMLLDGPSLFKRATNGFLNTMPQDGAFEVVVETGVKPLFKVETLNPYSTVNKTADGKYWSSKIPSGAGSQNAPVDTPAELAALAPYTAQTTIFSFGVGYANDEGNKALVTSVTFAGQKYNLTCAPKPPTQKPEPKKCEAYHYTGTSENLCAAKLSETGKVSCKDVKYRVTLVDVKDDPWGLDGNRGTKGVGCEGNPIKPKPAPSKTPVAASLPVTGSNTGVYVAGGGALVVAGIVFLAVARKRRKVFQA